MSDFHKPIIQFPFTRSLFIFEVLYQTVDISFKLINLVPRPARPDLPHITFLQPDEGQ